MKCFVCFDFMKINLFFFIRYNFIYGFGIIIFKLIFVDVLFKINLKFLKVDFI